MKKTTTIAMCSFLLLWCVYGEVVLWLMAVFFIFHGIVATFSE